MNLDQMKRSTDWFRVLDYKSVEDPSGLVARKEMIVALDEYPHDFRLGPNPREPRTTSKVSKAIAETLEKRPHRFHLLNRGITIVAKEVHYDNKSKRLQLKLHDNEEEERFFGILDGGNTNARINMWRQDLDDEIAARETAATFVNVQVLVPALNGSDTPSDTMAELLNDIKEARNTSVSVKEKSLADARRHFDQLKAGLVGQPYFDRISWHEGAPGNIDALDLIGLLMIFYPRFANDAGGEPQGVYSHKGRALNAYLNYTEKFPEEMDAWIEKVPSLVALFDEIQTTMPDSYSGSFGRISDVKIYDDAKYQEGRKKKYRRDPAPSKYFARHMKYSYPLGFIYPIFAGFRVLADQDDSKVVSWKTDPIEFWKRNADKLLVQFKPHMEAVAFEAHKIGQSTTCYQAMRHAVLDAYKDELLAEHGITV